MGFSWKDREDRYGVIEEIRNRLAKQTKVKRVKSDLRCSRDCPQYVWKGFCRLYKQVLRQDTDNTYRCDECKEKK